MGVIQIASAAVVAAVFAVLLKKDAPVFALMLGIAVSLIAVLSVMPQLGSIVNIISEIGSMTGEVGYAGILFKIIGITYVTQFAADICRDAGESALAGRVVLAGKILTAFYAMPVTAGLLEQINLMFG